jgi:peptidoglycan/LPS O-acetylase OafA/YrhL
MSNSSAQPDNSFVPTFPATTPGSTNPINDWHDGLEVLRGIAAMLVVLFHCTGLLPWDVKGTPLAVFGVGWTGVDLFFVISGYVITASAWRQKESPAYARNFWRTRFARILPLYYVTSIIYLLLNGSQAIEKDTTLQVVSHLLLFHNLFQETAFSINGVTWSLGVEMQFYLIAFLVVPSIAVASRRALVLGFIALLAGVLIYRLTAWHWLRADGASDAAISHALSQVPSLIDSFALGGLICLFGAPKPNRIRCLGLVFAAAVSFIAISVVYTNFAARYWSLWPMAILFRTFVAAFAGIALCAALSSRPQANSAWYRPMLRMGKISYGIYLWHLIVLYFVQRHVPLKGTAAVLVIVATTLLLAEITYRLVERPAMQWARGRRSHSA